MSAPRSTSKEPVARRPGRWRWFVGTVLIATVVVSFLLYWFDPAGRFSPPQSAPVSTPAAPGTDDGLTRAESGTASVPGSPVQSPPPGPTTEELQQIQAELDALAASFGPSWSDKLSAAVTYYCRAQNSSDAWPPDTMRLDAIEQAAEKLYDANWRYDSANRWPASFGEAAQFACQAQGSSGQPVG